MLVSFPKIFITGTVVLFTAIGIAAVLKKREPVAVAKKESAVSSHTQAPAPREIPKPTPVAVPVPAEKEQKVVELRPLGEPLVTINDTSDDEHIDRIGELFVVGPRRHPIVESITYTSRVPWLKGRPAWIADYAANFKTSKHFIARSLNRKADYFTQNVTPGARFNVLRSDIDITFKLVADLARCNMWFYWVNGENGVCELLKVYKIGVGVLDRGMPSGTLTPIGKFQLGDRVTSYKPGVMGFYRNERVEMIQIFGTRWIPFSSDEGVERDYGVGYGIHGAPCYTNEESGELVEASECIGKYDSDGCIRMLAQDLEELYAIVVTRPTTIEIFRDSKPFREELKVAQ